jgi:hypothetical protein
MTPRGSGVTFTVTERYTVTGHHCPLGWLGTRFRYPWGMASLNLQLIGLETLKPLLHFTNPKLLAKALKGGVKYAAAAGKTQAGKSISTRYTIKSRRIKQDIDGPFVRGDTATIVFSRRPPTLNNYSLILGHRGGPQPGLGRGKGWGKPSPKGKPLSGKIYKDGKRQKQLGAFMVNGLPMRYIRATGKYQVLYGPSIAADMFGDGRYGEVIRKEVFDRIQQQYNTGLKRVLDAHARGF